MTLVVGDIHGDLEAVEKALKHDDVIFVGDFLDSFEFLIPNQIKCLETVLNAIESGKARSCFGNHEISYLFGEHVCSGWNPVTQKLVDPFKERMLKLLSVGIQHGPFIITHAGLAPDFEDEPLTLDNPRVFKVGFYSGGHGKGGPFWLRPHEFDKHKKRQIFGHTPHNYITKYGEAYCIDVLQSQHKGLLIHDNFEVEAIDL